MVQLNLVELFTPKVITEHLHEATGDNPHGKYKKVLTAWDLIALGIGCIIGTGIFTLTGIEMNTHSGPGIVFSFLISGFVCMLAGLCYAEMASMIPVSGSAYTYTYATMGEFLAWILGWDLMLEYMISSSAVAVGVSGYMDKFFGEISGGNFHFDPRISNAPIFWDDAAGFGLVPNVYFNLPAFLSIVALTILLAVGIKQSSIFLNTLVILKVIVVIMFIFGGIKYIPNPNHLDNFLPYGAKGIFQSTIPVTFAYLGFDAVSTTSGEAKNPRRDIPIGILGSLAICTVLYIAVCLVLGAMIPYDKIPLKAPVTSALEMVGAPTWFTTIITFGALCGLTSVLMVTLLGQPRIFRSMAFDGLFPKSFAYIHPYFGTPFWTTICTGAIAAVLAGFLPIDFLANLSSVGTLFAFGMVSISVIILRIREPHRERKFKLPFGVVGGFGIPGVAVVAIVAMLVASENGGTYAARVGIWMAIGLVVYFCFGFWWSKHRHPEKWPASEVTITSPEDAEDAEEKKEEGWKTADANATSVNVA